MSVSQTVEDKELAPARAVVDHYAAQFKRRHFEARLQALEAASSCLGGFRLVDFQAAFNISPVCEVRDLEAAGKRIVAAIASTSIPAPLALSALAREPLEEAKRRSTGTYHTDFRLALYLAKTAIDGLRQDSRILDPACGTGILLVAVTNLVCGADRIKATEWLRNCVNAADSSPSSLRGALLSLAAYTDDLDSLIVMRSRWLCHDSLISDSTVWGNIAPGGFDLVIGNPPWERLKVTRHEFAKASGTLRHYGAGYENYDTELYKSKQEGASAYAARLMKRYGCVSGEVDLYVAFLELCLQITNGGGRTAVLVPGGLIRSQRTEALRRLILSSTSSVLISILENRAKFFSIDTRFKFVALTCLKSVGQNAKRNKPLIIKHASANSGEVVETNEVSIAKSALQLIRPDLTIPEVRGKLEWMLFAKMSRCGITWNDSADRWMPDIVREVDMTRDRRYFTDLSYEDSVPVVEGRMVQQHRFGAKAYVSGTGRRALWKPLRIGASRIAPQFNIGQQNLSDKVFGRTRSLRVGFCDITGQTNERSLMAAMIPPGVVCGNKVPTITFPADPSEERMLLWTGIANSFPFDWLLRRLVTTTVNYFVLLGVPLPRIAKESLPGRIIVDATRRLSEIDRYVGSARRTLEIAELRTVIDVTVAMAYGINYNDLKLILKDFPLLDRGQPSLAGEDRSTVTRDYVLYNFGRHLHRETPRLADRLSRALAQGAVPFVSAEYQNEIDEVGAHGG